MIARIPLARLFFALASLAVLPLAGCVVAIGPRYIVEDQKIDLTYPSGSPDLAEVHASYRLQNTGRAAVEDFDLDLPDPKVFKLQDVAILWSGQPVQQKPMGDSDIQFQFPLDAKWEVGARTDLQISYKFQTVHPERSASAASPAAYLLVGAGWYPELRPSIGPFSTIGSIPKRWDLSLTLPANYQVHAGGEQTGRSQKNGQAQLRFRQRQGGRQPFVVAGPFIHQDVKSGSLTVSFWSESPAATDRVREIAQRVSAANDYYVAEFGPRLENPSNAWIFECPERAGTVPQIPWLERAGCMTLPGSVVVPRGFLSGPAPASGSSPDPQSLAAQFAATWLFGMNYPNETNPLFPMAGAPAYAAFALETARAPVQREATIQALLERVPPAQPAAGESRPKPLGAIARDDSPELRETALVKSELFFIALEDRCGAPHIHRAIIRLRRIMRHDRWTAEDLRSAVEAECGADLGEFFRNWLDASDVPQDFRARYSGAAIKPESEEKR